MFRRSGFRFAVKNMRRLSRVIINKILPATIRIPQSRRAIEAVARWRSGDAEAVQGLPSWFESRSGLQFFPAARVEISRRLVRRSRGEGGSSKSDDGLISRLLLISPPSYFAFISYLLFSVQPPSRRPSLTVESGLRGRAPPGSSRPSLRAAPTGGAPTTPFFMPAINDLAEPGCRNAPTYPRS